MIEVHKIDIIHIYTYHTVFFNDLKALVFVRISSGSFRLSVLFHRLILHLDIRQLVTKSPSLPEFTLIKVKVIHIGDSMYNCLSALNTETCYKFKGWLQTLFHPIVK